MGSKEIGNENRRIKKRLPLQLRVDVKILPKREVEGILDGEGYPDLSMSSLAMSRPRSGMIDTQTIDVSYSGIGIKTDVSYEKGTATALDLHLPGERTVVKLLGEVMWAKNDDGASPRVGIRVAAFDEDNARRFAGYLSHFS